MKYDVAQVLIPPDTKHTGVGFYSTETELVDELLEKIKAFTTNNAKFETQTVKVDEITTGTFNSLMQKDSSVGWLIIKIMIEKGWDLVSACVDGEYSSLFFRYHYEDSE